MFSGTVQLQEEITLKHIVVATLTLLAVCAIAVPSSASASTDGGCGPNSARSASQAIVANDNRVPAGRRTGSVVALTLVAGVGRWKPDRHDVEIPIEAFGECGKSLQIPGPTIRVPARTQMIVTIRNPLDRPLELHGLVARPAALDRTIVVAPGATRIATFSLDTPGTYFYWGTTTGSSFARRYNVDSQLSGAIVVDSPDPTQRVADDRIFVIGRWDNVLRRDGTPNLSYELSVINGRTWPDTERLSYAKNDLVRWRWINASPVNHPLHLHGFFFNVDARGNALRETAYRKDDRDLAVTERIVSGETDALTWRATRPGSWLFHCHLAYHAIGHLPIATMLAGIDSLDGRHIDDELVRGFGMGGLMMGVTVAGNEPVASARNARRIGLVVERAPDDAPTAPSYRYALTGTQELPFDNGSASAPTLILERGKPVAIDIANHLDVPTQIHWHGIEMSDSYYDGVAGIGGSPARATPMVMPTENFVALFTPPRAGTFIYHTHMDDVWQLRAGLAGALVVTEPNAPFDPASDHVVVLGTPHAYADRFGVLVNDAKRPAAMTVRVGEPQRLRLVNMTTFRHSLTVSLVDDGTVARWRPIARDGASLPPSRRQSRVAVQIVTIGQTRDFTFTPRVRGTLQLHIDSGLPRPQSTSVVDIHVI